MPPKQICGVLIHPGKLNDRVAFTPAKGLNNHIARPIVAQILG
jgi:hypothetical protein